MKNIFRILNKNLVKTPTKDEEEGPGSLIFKSRKDFLPENFIHATQVRRKGMIKKCFGEF